MRDSHKAEADHRSAVLNGSRSKLRKRRTERAHSPAVVAVAASAEQMALVRDDEQRVIGALSTLPRRQREVLVLRYYLDLSEAEIADTLGISRGSVKSHSSRGIDAMGTALGATND